MIYIVWLQDLYTMCNLDLWAYSCKKQALAKEKSLSTIENDEAGLRCGLIEIRWANTKKQLIKNINYLNLD